MTLGTSGAVPLIQDLTRYSRPSWSRASFELVMTVGLLIASWFPMWLSLGVGYWLTLLIAIPAAGFLVRLCSSFSTTAATAPSFRTGRQRLGRPILGVLTFTPYDYWKRNHAIHHATSGDLDRRGIGDILTLTVDEYRPRSAIGAFLLSDYRNPLVMFGIGPAFLFLLQHRLAVRADARGLASVDQRNREQCRDRTLAGIMILIVGVWRSLRSICR